MVDTITTTAIVLGNDHDDWEVAVDSGEFDKRLEQQEKDRAATQESIFSSITSDRNLSNTNLIQSNKPIRILKRPTSQSQLPVNNNNIPNSSTTITTNNNHNSPFSNDTSSSTNSIIPQNETKDFINSSQIINTSLSSSSTSQSIKPAMKTYEQRELEYRLARLRIMGEEESSVKDIDDNTLSVESAADESDKSTSSTLSKTTFSQP